MINTILWDFDGTLVDTNELIIASWQHTYRHFLGYEKPVEVITRCFGEPLLVTLEREFPEVSPEESSMVYRKYQKEMSEELIKAVPGIPEAIESFRSLGLKQCIVTSRTGESTKRYLSILGLENSFDGIVSCEDTEAHKPNPAPIFLALSKLGVKADEAIMIGDGPFDIKCANNAGVRSVLVGWRATGDSNPIISDAKETYEVETPEALVELINTILTT